MIVFVLLADKCGNITFKNESFADKQTALTGIIYSHVKAKDGEYCLKSGNMRILLKVSDDHDAEMLARGIKASLILTPKLPYEATNFGEFEYKNYLRGRNITYTATIEAKDITLLKKDPFSLTVFGARIRYAIKKVLRENLDERGAAFTEAIITGETGEMDETDRQLIRISGISHLTAVSGMHVMYFILPVKRMLRNKKTGIRLRNLILIPFLVLFASVADMSCSVMRAVITNVVICVSGFFQKPLDRYNSLGITGCVQMIINPYSIYNSGFVLSYLSILGIYAVVPFLKNTRQDVFGPVYTERSVFDLREYLINTLLTTLSVNIMLFPAMVYYYGEVSLLGLFLNVPASPLTCIIFICGFLLLILSQLHFAFSAGFVSLILRVLSGIFGVIIKAGDMLSKFFGVYTILFPGVFITGCYYVILSLLISGMKDKKRLAVYMAFAVIFLFNLQTAYESRCVITVMDVGQSSCSIV
ncbi:MAG: ComEC/Rec2 family competence protein, partial [Clostridia bacterium]|nr:ComEC/Rec2 family competence protein [Clostridia bacterium]